MNPQDTLNALGITVESVFVPFSQSRNKDSEYPNLNWRVTIKRNGRDVLTTDYSAGMAHCPGYNAETVPDSFFPRHYRNSRTGETRAATSSESLNQWREYLVTAECESGFAMKPRYVFSSGGGNRRPDLVPLRKRKEAGGKQAPVAIEPNPVDVLYSLTMDSEVLDSGGFEYWAADFGYDTDSRAAETVYSACLELALQMRAGFGSEGMAALQTVYRDY